MNRRDPKMRGNIPRRKAKYSQEDILERKRRLEEHMANRKVRPLTIDDFLNLPEDIERAIETVTDRPLPELVNTIREHLATGKENMEAAQHARIPDIIPKSK